MLGPKLGGLRSAFGRAARRVKAFFGWDTPDSEAEEAAAALAFADLKEATDSFREKSKRSDDSGDGGGNGTGGSGFSSAHKHEDKDMENQGNHGESESELISGNDKNLVNFAKPVGMTDEEWNRRTAELKRVQRQREEEIEANQKKRERSRLRQDQVIVKKQIHAKKARELLDGGSGTGLDSGARIKVRVDSLYSESALEDIESGINDLGL